MKRRVYSYGFSGDKSILEQLKDCNKAVDDLVACDVKVSDEDKAILALNALPDSYDQLRDAILYGRDKEITFSKVHSALMAKELQKEVSEEIQKETTSQGGAEPDSNSHDGQIRDDTLKVELGMNGKETMLMTVMVKMVRETTNWLGLESGERISNHQLGLLI